MMEEENNQEETEIEVFEFSLNDEEIDELIVKLVELKHIKQPFNFEVDDENEFLVSYEDDTMEDIDE